MSRTALPTAAPPRPATDDLAGIRAETRWALSKALFAGGDTLHLRQCLAKGVNSQIVPCAPDCIRAQKALALLVGTS